MKRAITALSILCGGLLFINPVADIFAQSQNNEKIIQQAQFIENRTDKKVANEEIINENQFIINEQKEEVKPQNIEEVKNVENKLEIAQKQEVTQQEVTQQEVAQIDKLQNEETNKLDKNESTKEEQATKKETINEEVKEESKVEVIDVLNKEQAEELLKMYKKDVQFTYEGDENNFQELREKGLSGYVFFPDYDTDLGFIVEKNTASIYYFHPSGYIELAL